MQITSTSTFRESLRVLCKKPKHAYGSCPNDICSEFGDKSIDSLITPNNVVLQDDGIKCLLKIRVACASRNVGKSGGFRLIAYGNRQNQELALLDVYPKVGPFGKSNVDTLEIKRLLSTYIYERDEGKLVILDATNQLIEVVAI